MGTTQPGTIVLLVFYVFYSLVVCILFIRRRNVYPINHRLPAFCLLQQTSFAMAIINLSTALFLNFQRSCIWYHWLAITHTAAIAAGYTARVIHFYVRYKIMQELMERNQALVYSLHIKEIRLDEGWWTQRQRYITPRYLFAYFISFVLSAIPFCVIFYFSYPYTLYLNISDSQCPLIYSFTQNIIFAVLAWSASILILFIAFRAKDLEEGLWMRREYFIGVAYVTLHHILLYVPTINRSHEIEALAYMGLCLLFVSITYTLPVYASFKTIQFDSRACEEGDEVSVVYIHTRRIKLVKILTCTESPETKSRTAREQWVSDQSTSGQTASHTNEGLVRMRMIDYLQHPEHFMAFQSFLAKEFAVENLLFWRDVRILRKYTEELFALEERATSDQPLYQMLQAIYRMYIANDAVESINISDKLRLEISKLFQTIRPESIITVGTLDQLFQQAVREVLNMLESGAFLRFQNSDFFVQNMPHKMVVVSESKDRLIVPDNGPSSPTSFRHSDPGYPLDVEITALTTPTPTSQRVHELHTQGDVSPVFFSSLQSKPDEHREEVEG